MTRLMRRKKNAEWDEKDRRAFPKQEVRKMAQGDTGDLQPGMTVVFQRG